MNWKSELLTVIFFQSTKRPVVAALFMKNHYKVLVRGVYQCQVYDTVALTCVFLDLCWYWVTLHLKPLISQGILYIIFFFFLKYIFLCVFVRQQAILNIYVTVFVLSDSHSLFFVFFISAFCQNAVYSTRLWQQQPHSKDVIGATMCLLNKKYALSAHYVKPWSKKKKKKKKAYK